MATLVVCISRTDGADGEAVGAAVARDLGYRYVDHEIVDRAAEKAGIDRATMANVEHRKSFVRRLLHGLPSAPTFDPIAAITGPPLTSEELSLRGPRAGQQDARDVIRSVIADLAEEGRVVIVSHAASLALADVPSVLRVLVTASAAVRAGRISRGGKWLEPAAAAAAVDAVDRNRQDYFRRFYDVAREEPTHYDLVVNTDVLTAQQAAAVVCAAAHAAAS
jgi:cytidylate kinase